MSLVKKMTDLSEQLRNALIAKEKVKENTESQLAQANESVAAARQTLGHAELALERSFGNQEADVHLAWDAVKIAKDELSLAESRYQAILKKLEETGESQRQAAHELKCEDLLAAVRRQRERAKKADSLIAQLAGTVKEWGEEEKVIRSHGSPELNNAQQSARIAFKVRLLDRCGMPEHRTGLSPYVGSKPWVEDHLAETDVLRIMSLRRKTA